MNTILKTLTLVIALFLCSSVIAQPTEPGEKIKRLRVAFITERLDLTVEESEKFWPIFNKYDKVRMATKKDLKTTKEEIKNSSISGNDLLKKLEYITELRKKEADNDLAMMQELIPVIGPDKIKILVGLEEEFKRKLIDKIRERRTERGGGRTPLRRD